MIIQMIDTATLYPECVYRKTTEDWKMLPMSTTFNNR